MGLFKGNKDQESVDRAIESLASGAIAKGVGGQVEIDGDWITIKRSGALGKVTHGFGGDKRIPIANVTAVRLKEPGLTNGYIQFSLLGGQERSLRKAGDIGSDENTVLFSKKHLAEFVAIKNHVEARIAQGVMPRSAAPAPTIDVADQLGKLAALRDQGILSEEEFTAQKAKLLAG